MSKYIAICYNVCETTFKTSKPMNLLTTTPMQREEMQTMPTMLPANVTASSIDANAVNASSISLPRAVLAYLSGLSAKGRRSMSSRIKKIAEMLGYDVETCPWNRLSYETVSMLR